MIEPRIYRAALLPVLLAVVLVMFSLENQPRPLAQGLAADALFDGATGLAILRDIVAQAPDRRPGSAGNAAIAGRVAAEFRRSGFSTTTDDFSKGGHDLQNVIARRPGASRRQIVVMAARDATSVPDATTSAADTAALLALARVFKGRALRKTIVLVSVDGSSLGDAGARRFAEHEDDRERSDAVLVISSFGARPVAEPLLIGWSTDASRPDITLRRTALASLRHEIGGADHGEGVFEQFARLSFPLGIGAQAVLLKRGTEAIRFSGSGELFPARGDSELADVDVARLGQLGRALLRTVSALDAGRRLDPPGRYLVVARKIVPGWALSTLALTLTLPTLIIALDGYARLRRRRQPVAVWSRWLVANSAPWLVGIAVATFLALLRFADDLPAAPNPAAHPFGVTGAISLCLTVLAIVLAWVFGRRRVMAGVWGRGPLPDAAAPGASGVTALALSLAALVIWALNPFTALALVPALYLWPLATLAAERGRRTGPLLVVLGAVLPVTAALIYVEQLSLNPLESVWYAFLLVGGGYPGLVSSLLGCLVLGCLTSVLAIVAAGLRRRPQVGERPSRSRSIRAPGGYPERGALGGIESALRR